MTFIHMDATSAASVTGDIVSLPSSIFADAGGNGFQGNAQVIFGGEDHSTYEGLWVTKEDGYIADGPTSWIDPNRLALIPNYFFRSIDIVDYGSSKGSEPGSDIYYSGVWTGGRTDWRSFATVSPHGNMTADASAVWQCSAYGEQGEPYLEEDWDGVLEIGRLIGITETFDGNGTDVDTGNDEFVLTGHGFETGDQVVYQIGSGDAPSPLVDQAMYSVRKITNDRISLGISLFSIDATPSFLNITTTGTGTGHSFRRIDAEVSCFLGLSASI